MRICLFHQVMPAADNVGLTIISYAFNIPDMGMSAAIKALDAYSDMGSKINQYDDHHPTRPFTIELFVIDIHLCFPKLFITITKGV